MQYMKLDAFWSLLLVKTSSRKLSISYCIDILNSSVFELYRRVKYIVVLITGDITLLHNQGIQNTWCNKNTVIYLPHSYWPGRRIKMLAA